MLKTRIKRRMLDVKSFSKQGFIPALPNVLLRQLFFLFTAIFLFFTFVSVVNAIPFKHRVLQENFPHNLTYIVVFSPVVDSTVFYFSAISILVFPLLDMDCNEWWLRVIISYMPLSLSFAGFLFQDVIVGQFFLSLSCILCLFWIFSRSLSHHWWGFQKKTGLANTLGYFCIVFFLIELFSLLFWLLSPFTEINGWISIFQQIAMVELRFFYAPTFLAPFLILFTLFAWLLIPLRLWLKKDRTWVLRFAGKELNIKKALSADLNCSLFKVLDGKPWIPLFLLASSFSSLIYVFYAYHPVLFGRKQFIGIDIPNYVSMVESIQSSDLSYTLSYAFTNFKARPLSLLILYGFSLFGLPLTTAVQFSPFFLSPLLVLASYFFLRSSGLDRKICLLCGLFSSFSFIVIIGLLAGFISNMMAWIAALIFFGLLVKSLGQNSKLFCSLAAFALLLVLFLHVYTWSFLIIILGFLMLVYFFRHILGFPGMAKLKLVSMIIISNIAVELVRSFIHKSGSVAVKSGANLVQAGVSLNNLWQFWNTLNMTLSNRLFGFFMNPIMLFFAAVGVLTAIYNVWPKQFCLLVKCWCISSSFLLIFGNHIVQPRILYVLPFHVLATFGTVSFGCWIKKFFKGSPRAGEILAVLSIFLVVLVNVNYALRFLTTY